MNKSEMEANKMEEIWKDIEGYEGLYQISNLGRVKSLNYKGTGKEHFMKLNKNNSDCLAVHLTKNNKVRSYSVEKLLKNHFMKNSNSQHNRDVRDDRDVRDTRIEILPVRVTKEEKEILKNYMKINNIKNRSKLLRELIYNLKNEMEENK